MMLDGVHVLELGTTITAPLAAMLLADLGADVIKIERPEGDPFRRFGGGTYGPHFAAYNRNKRSVVLDLTSESGRDAFFSLLAGADVLIDNYRPGVLERLGLAPDVLRARNPRMIHCSITGFGASGPYRDRPAFDAVAQAVSGISSLFLDRQEPRVTGPTISDNVTGMYACQGILGALYERTRTGKGRRIEINMLEASIAFIPDAFASFTQLGLTVTASSRVAASQSYAFRCADGELLAIHLSSLEKFWKALTTALDLPEIENDPRFATRMDRLRNYEELRATLSARFREHPRDEWIRRLGAVDIPFAPVRAVPEVLDDPQVEALGTFYTMSHPTEGSLVGVHSPFLVDGERITPKEPPPTIGEHTDEVLATPRAPFCSPHRRAD
jgi:formyl-CoA transferase